MLPYLLLLAAAPAAATDPAPATSSAEASSFLKQAIGAILRADGDEARLTLEAIPSGQLDDDDRKFRACSVARLDDTTPRSVDRGASAEAILSRYRAYWTDAVADEAARVKLEEPLRADLARRIGLRSAASWEDVETAIAERLSEKGLHSQMGRTGHLRDLMIWREQSTKSENVDLPGATTQTNVTYLDGFVSRGWSSYFTCDRTGTGGWTTDKGLFVVVPAYKSLADEHFRVNFLAHESQHFVDKSTLPALEDWELEYRAKLVELSLARETLPWVLASFTTNRSTDPAEPHSYANAKVLDALRRRLRLSPDIDLQTIDPAEVRLAAREELAFDSGRRRCSPNAPA